jgi:hypothetical protein
MLKFLKNIIVFVLFSAFIYVSLIIVWGEVAPNPLRKNLIYSTGSYGYTLTRLQEVKKTKNIDILFLGSSHSYRSFDNRIFKEYGGTSFNLGSNAQSAIQTNLLLKRYLKQLNPKVVIYEVYPGNLSFDGIESSLNIISNDDINCETIEMAFQQNNLKIYNSIVYGFFKDAIKNKNTINEDLNRFEDTYISGGYVEKKIKYHKIIEHQTTEWKIQDTQLEYFEKNLKLIKDNNAKVIFVFAPITKNYYNSKKNNHYYDSIIQSYGEYYNFNKLMRLDDSLHFYDYHHLNQKGVELFNRKMITVLERQFNL